MVERRGAVARQRHAGLLLALADRLEGGLDRVGVRVVRERRRVQLERAAEAPRLRVDVGLPLEGAGGHVRAGLAVDERPERAERVISLEGFGIAPTTPDMAPERYRNWFAELNDPPRMHVYPDRAAFARRLMKSDPYLTAERADFLSRHLARIGDGTNKHGERRHGIVWNGDPWHKATSPYLFRLEESMAIWRQITCPVLWVAGRQSWVVRDYAARPGDWEARRACFADVREEWIDDSDHMMHHDQPEAVAALIEEFFP